MINWRKVFYHPVRGRVVYDLLVSVVAYGLVECLAYVVGQIPLHVHEWLIYAGLIVIINFGLGVYGRYKISTPLTKTALLTASVILSSATLLILDIPYWQLIATGIYTLLLLVLPRWFFSVNRGQLWKGSYQLIHDSDPILVVGGGGYIGSHVVTQLLKAKQRVRVFDTFYYGKEVFRDLKSKNLEVVSGDITDVYSLTKAMSNVRAVVHLAGIVGDPAAALDDELTRHLNIVTTRMVKESVKGFGIPRLIFASSCSVYGAAEYTVNENSNLNPVSLYAQTKIDAEKEILLDTYDLFHPTILRFATVFGHSQRMRFDLVANLFTAQAYINGKITVRGSKQWRPMVHVSDIARAIVMTLDAPLEKVSRQIFNVGDDKQNTTIRSMAEMAKMVVGQSRRGKEVQIVIDDTVEDRRNYHVSFEKIRKTLGFEAKTNLEQGIAEMYDHFKAGDYQKPFTDPLYSNLEMTKLIQKEFHSDAYRKTHFSLLAK